MVEPAKPETKNTAVNIEPVLLVILFFDECNPDRSLGDHGRDPHLVVLRSKTSGNF